VSGAVTDQRGASLRRFKPYPTYKDSGVEWIGGIPSHWDVKRLKYLARMTDERSHTVTLDLPYVGLEDIESGTGRLIRSPESASAEGEAPEGTASVFQPGDVLFGKLRPYLAKVLRAEFEGRCSTELLVLRSLGDIAPSVLAYQLLSRDFIRWVDAMTYGTKMPRANPDQVMGIPVALASAQEQRAIAAFLDRSTAKIDALVAKKERLIELLQERRTTLITQAVTKGLDPNVPMKDSGVEWLGEIPGHWAAKRIKHLSRVVTSGSRGWAGHYADDGSLFLRIGNLKIGAIDLDLSDVQHVRPPAGAEGERTRVRSGDVLVSITALIGAVGVVPDGITDGFVNQHLALIRPSQDDVAARWLGYCVLSRVGQQQLLAELYGGTKDGLGLEDIRSVLVLVPPPIEQQRIAKALDSMSEKVDSTITTIRDAIDCLRELRTALVSAAVTGKIDVREEVA
jgi:type I restriction enzyme S subunit